MIERITSVLNHKLNASIIFNFKYCLFDNQYYSICYNF